MSYFFYRLPRAEVHIPHLPHSQFGRSRFYALFLNNSPQTERFAMLHSDDFVPSRSSGCNWRLYVYQRNLYALPLLDVTGRTRDISASFYRTNPNQIFRLLPWINREILMIVRRHEIHHVMTMIEEFLTSFDITSRAFRTRIKTFLNRYTAHFIHELTNFARSQYDMNGYDRYVQYSPVFEDLIDVADDSNDDSDDDPVLVSDLDSTTQEQAPAAVNRTDDSVIVFNNYRNLDWSPQLQSGGVIFERRDYYNVHGSNSGSSSSATSTQSAGSSFGSQLLRDVISVISPQTEIEVQPDVSVATGTETVNATPATSESLLNNPVEAELVNIESDDSDECMYVGEQKPPHLRTPVMVELNSDSDSDVIFVNEDKALPPIKQECSNGDPATSAEAIEPSTSTMALLMSALEPHMTMLSSSSDMEDFLPRPGTPSITVNRRKHKVSRPRSSLMLSSSSEDLHIPLSQWKRKNERLSPVAGGSGITHKSASPNTVATGSNFTTAEPVEESPSVITKNYARPVRHITPPRIRKPRARIYKAPSCSMSSSSEMELPERRLSMSSSVSSVLRGIPTHSEGNSLSSSESSHEEFSVTKTKSRGSSVGSRAIPGLKKRRIVKRLAATLKSTNIPPIASLAAAKAKTSKSKIPKGSSSKSKRQSQSATRTIDRRQRRRRKSRQTLSKKLKNIADGDAAVDAPQRTLANVTKRRRLLSSSDDEIDSKDEVDSSDDSQISS